MQRTIGQYLLVEQVGSTGLATVYRAQEPRQEREVALKVLRPYVSSDEALLDRFSKQMGRVALLKHPNILPTHAMGSENGVHWVAMQYVSWPTLRQWLQHPIPAAHAMVILRQVVGAVEAARAEGLTHGDIKPGNIFIDPESGQVLLSDFGMAVMGEGASATVTASLDTPLPTYTAPELGQGSPSSFQSDIYSLGILMYDMLTGTVPFNALQRATVRARQLTSAPPLPSSVNPNIPLTLDSILMKALAPHPERRFETAQEFVDALAASAPTATDPEALFPFSRETELQASLPGMDVPQVSPWEDHRPPILCTVCGFSNAPDAEWCADCWGVLRRVGAGAEESVVSTAERTVRNRRANRLRRALVGLGTLAVFGYTMFQILDISPPLKAPTSDISSQSEIGEWAMINRNFSGLAEVPGEDADLTGEVKWTFETSEPLGSTPAVKGGKVYLTTLDKRVVALDEATGELIWEYASVAPIDSSPAVAGDLVIYGARDRRVMALDADTGKLRWEFVAESNPNYGSPIVRDGIVYIGSGDSHIYALDALTGKEQWRFATRGWITNTPALSEDILAVSSLDGRVTMYDTDTGKRRFSFRGFSRDVVGSPIIVGESIYVPYRNGLLYSIDLNAEEALFASRLYRLKVQLYVWDMIGSPGLPRGVQWATSLRGTLLTTPTTDGDNIFLTSQEGKVYAVDGTNGTRLWTHDLKVPRLSAPTLVDGVLLVGDQDGVVHALDSVTGDELWTIQVGTGATSTPVVAGGTMYIASRDGTLYAVQ